MSDNPETEKNEYEILPDDYTQYDLSFKVIVIGNSGVGKSSFTNNAVKNIFEDEYNTTIGFEFFSFNIKLKETIIKLQIWDTCGQELYRSLISNFYRNASLAIVVYAVNNNDSFQDVDMWFRELRTHASPDIKIFLVGNKTDLVDERVVTTKQGEEFAKLNHVTKFIEASAKNSINTQSTFIEIAKLLFDEYNKYKDEDIKTVPTFHNKDFTESSVNSQTLKKEQAKKKKKCCGKS